MEIVERIKATHETVKDILTSVREVLAIDHEILIHHDVQSRNPTAVRVSSNLDVLDLLLRSEWAYIDADSGECEPARQCFADACQPVILCGTYGSSMHDAVVRYARRLVRTVDEALILAPLRQGEVLSHKRLVRSCNWPSAAEPPLVVEKWDVVSEKLREFPKLDHDYVLSVLKGEKSKAVRLFASAQPGDFDTACVSASDDKSLLPQECDSRQIGTESDGNSARDSYSSPGNYDRDKWIFEQRTAGKTLSYIQTALAELAEKMQCLPLESDNGIRAAVERYARHHNLEVPKGQPGRPKTRKA